MLVSPEAKRLATYIFEENQKDANFVLTMHGLQDSYELFSFCVFLAMHGLVYLLGGDPMVEVEKIPPEVLQELRAKMMCAGIDFGITMEPKPPNVPSSVQIKTKSDPKYLDDYALFINSKETTFIMTFDLKRQNVIKTCHQLKI